MNGESGNMAGATKARLEWVDSAKGVGIILVVIAHVWTRGPVRDAIYAFHMPLFFLLSGYMSKPRAMGDFVPKLLRSMALPYVAFLLVLAAFDLAFELWRGHHPIFRDWSDALWRLGLGGSELRGPFTIFWFVPALFFGRLALNVLALQWPDVRDWRWAGLMALVAVFGVWIGARSDFSPLGLLSVPIVLVFLWAGMLWRTVADDRRLMLVALLLSAVGLWAYLHWHMAPLNMKVGDYGRATLALPLALILSLGLCAIVRQIPEMGLAALGRMSLVIMYLHVAVIHYLSPYLDKTYLLISALFLPILAYRLLNLRPWSKKIFLGQG
jgi:fucose 4-O-acetylase-like acetyltransferase